ncbi:MarR family winged helix-turn-helix transcriptional regulator [Iningainema tapete]|uniref:MarR family transcriptional regulator n=1 Tax=Iningainema tapete BLCC-T55 TaxID=2748662 RepID=A0A8J6XU12_9CYAN|nr:MarR family transcriptional regulator [Iningainema tapete]MBD2773908.1 MarR family transcriptional regulator [Iningainema tapete BLCC-T55]
MDYVDYILKQWSDERPDLDGSAMGIIGRIVRLARHFERKIQNNLVAFDLSIGEFEVLATLRRSGAPYQLSPTDLYKSVMLSSGAMTNRVDRLEQAGLVYRSRDKSDRRGVLVCLTPEGLTLIDQVIAVHFASMQQLLAELTPVEQKLITDSLRKLLLTFEESTCD